MTTLDTLLEVQARDTTLDQLRHEHAALPEREQLAALEAETAAIDARLAEARAARDAVLADEKRLDDEAASLEAKASAADQKLYSGSITSPKELEALQADVASLRKHRDEVEDRELEVMERREAADAEVAAIEVERADVDARADGVRAVLAGREAELDARIAEEAAARSELTEQVDGALLAEYERRRVQARGIGVARLVGPTCQGCHIALPATEVERIRHAAADALNFCDNCGCILVVSA